MAQKRRLLSLAFKVQIAWAAIKGVEAVVELAQKHKLRATQFTFDKYGPLQRLKHVLKRSRTDLFGIETSLD